MYTGHTMVRCMINSSVSRNHSRARCHLMWYLELLSMKSEMNSDSLAQHDDVDDEADRLKRATKWFLRRTRGLFHDELWTVQNVVSVWQSNNFPPVVWKNHHCRSHCHGPHAEWTGVFNKLEDLVRSYPGYVKSRHSCSTSPSSRSA